MSRVEVAIVGAGPYGLSLASHLAARRTRFRVVGRAMDSWLRHMPEGMLLKSEGFASNIDDPAHALTLEAFCASSGEPYEPIGRPVSRETFAAYGLWFRDQAGIEVEETDVTGIRADGDGFTLELASGESFAAGRVVIATGFAQFPHVPAALRDVAGDRVTHTVDHVSLSRFEGAEVAVIGGGQSAIETAALLHEQGARPRLLVRAPSLVWGGKVHGHSFLHRLRWPLSPLGTGYRLWAFANLPQAFRFLRPAARLRLAQETLGPAGAWWIRERVLPAVPVDVGHTVTGAEEDGDRIRLSLSANGSRRELVVDHVVLGTGFRFELERLGFLPDEMRARVTLVGRFPHLSPQFESSVRGLYFVGLGAAASFGPVMRFVCGTGFASRTIAAHVDGHSPERAAAGPPAR